MRGRLGTLTGALVVLSYDFLFHPTLSLGDGIGLLSGFFYAAYFLITQRGRQHLSAIEYLWLITCVSFLTQVVFSVILGLPLSGYSTQTYLSVLGAALFVQVIGFFAIAYALGHIPASVVAPTLIAQPVLSAILAIPFMGETLHAAQWVGGLAVLAGIYLINRRPAERAEPVVEVV